VFFYLLKLVAVARIELVFELMRLMCFRYTTPQ
jgi:hypothetical protein